MAQPSAKNYGPSPISCGGILNSKYDYNGRRVINSSGSEIGVDKLVAIIGYDVTTGYPKIVLADANNRQHADVYVTLAAIAEAAQGYVYKGGLSVADLNTNSASTVGDPIYLSTTAGGFTHTAPTDIDASVIPVGWSTVKSATVGRIHWRVQAAERFGAGAVQGGPLAEVVAATNAITASENGKVFFLDHATEFASTLPAPFLGGHYTFICANAPESANFTIVTEGGCQILAGHTFAARSAGDSLNDVETAATGTTITFVQAVAVVGDRAEVWSDGVSWFASCFSSTVGGITITG